MSFITKYFDFVNFIFNISKLYYLFSLFIIGAKKLNRTYNEEIMDIFFELITKNKKHHLLKTINNKENLRIIIRDEILSKKETITCNI